jgi:hypothetical protein
MVGILVQLPCIPHRRVRLPILARLWLPRRPDQTKQLLALQLLQLLQLLELVTAQCPDRTLHVVADAAYVGETMRALPGNVTITARLRADAALYELTPPRTAPGRARPKGARMPELIWLADMVAIRFEHANLSCYGKIRTLHLAVFCRLW